MERRIPFAFALAFLVLAISLAEQGSAGRTSPRVVFGNSSYTFHNNSARNLNWIESRKRCKDIGSDLVCIESKKEWFFLKTTIRSKTTTEYFIGLKKDSKSGEWRWISDNSKVNDTKGKFPWAKDEPSGNVNCAVMYKDYRRDYGLFNGLSCTAKQRYSGYICESSFDSGGQKEPTIKQTTSPCTGASKESTTKPSTTHSLAVTSTARLTIWASQPTEPTSTDPTTTAKALEGGEQANDKDGCSTVVIILASLLAVTYAALLIFAVCFYSWQKKQRKDTANATDTGNQLEDEDGSSLSPENVARQLVFSDEAELRGIKRENQGSETDQSSRQECGYAMLTHPTMRVPKDSSYASLVKSKQEDCINESSVVASPLLQHDEELHDEPPTYVNVRSKNYMNV